MQEIESILGQHMGDMATQVTDAQTREYVNKLINQVQKIRSADRLQHIETTDISEAVVKTLAKMNQVLNAHEKEASVPAILIECVECLFMGARLTTDLNLSGELAQTSLRICSRVKLSNNFNIVEHLTAILLRNFTEKIAAGSLVSFGQVTVPSWISSQVELL